MAAFLGFRFYSEPCAGEVPMKKDDPRSSPEFAQWLKVNAVFGSILAIGMLAMALAGLYPASPPDKATDFSRVTAQQ